MLARKMIFIKDISDYGNKILKEIARLLTSQINGRHYKLSYQRSSSYDDLDIENERLVIIVGLDSAPNNVLTKLISDKVIEAAREIIQIFENNDNRYFAKFSIKSVDVDALRELVKIHTESKLSVFSGLVSKGNEKKLISEVDERKSLCRKL